MHAKATFRQRRNADQRAWYHRDPEHARDHVIPLAKGGTGHIANLQIVHLKCNCAKNQKAPHQLTGQHEINFAGNRAYLNASQGTERSPNTQDNSAGLGNGQRLIAEEQLTL